MKKKKTLGEVTGRLQHQLEMFDLDTGELEEHLGELQDKWVWEGDEVSKIQLEDGEEIRRLRRNSDVEGLLAKHIQMEIDNEILSDLENLVEQEKTDQEVEE